MNTGFGFGFEATRPSPHNAFSIRIQHHPHSSRAYVAGRPSQPSEPSAAVLRLAPASTDSEMMR